MLHMVDLDTAFQLAEVLEEYIIASDDNNVALKEVKRKQFKKLYKNLMVSSPLQDELMKAKGVSKEQQAKYDKEIDQMAEQVLILME